MNTVLFTTEALRRIAQAVLRELEQIDLESQPQQQQQLSMIVPTAGLSHSQDEDWSIILRCGENSKNNSEEPDQKQPPRDPSLLIDEEEKGLFKVMQRYIDEDKLKTVFGQRRRGRMAREEEAN
jgi:hypothetical protein